MWTGRAGSGPPRLRSPLMRLRAALGLLLLVLVTGCGGAPGTVQTVATTALRPADTTATPPLRVGVVGDLPIDVPGTVVQHGTLEEVSQAQLVLVSASAATLSEVAAAARANPSAHYALIGAATKGDRATNLVGAVLRDDEAARLAGVVAGLVAAGEPGAAPKIAWVGPEERKLAGAYGKGARSVLGRVVVLRQWSRSLPSRCKEAALTAIGRGALVVAAHGGACAAGAAAAAHEHNLPALRLGDFELPTVAAEFIAREAVGGVFRGREDLLFGAGTGVIGVRRLDPRIPVATAVRARAAAQQLSGGRPASG